LRRLAGLESGTGPERLEARKADLEGVNVWFLEGEEKI